MDFGSQLRKIRESRELLQSDVERMGRFCRSTISSYERNLINPSLIGIAKLCAILGCTPNDLITEEYIESIELRLERRKLADLYADRDYQRDKPFDRKEAATSAAYKVLHGKGNSKKAKTARGSALSVRR